MNASATKISGVLVLIAVVAIVFGVSYALNFVESTVKPRYAVEWASLFIVEHMESSNGQWPQGWEDLRDEFQRREEGHYAWTFEELQTLVEVRWDLQLPRDRGVFSNETFRAISIPADNAFADGLEADLVRWNRELRDYALSGELSQWQRDNIVTPRD